MWHGSCGSYQPRWHALQVQHGCEHSVWDALVHPKDAAHHRWEAYSPASWDRREYLDRDGKRLRIRHIRRPMFPGYLLVQFNVAVDPWTKLNHVRGVREPGLLAHPNGQPMSFGQAEMEIILAMERTKEADAQRPAEPFEPGTTVRVNSGAWRGFEGEVVSIAGEHIRLLMSLFGRSTPVKLPLSQVEAI